MQGGGDFSRGIDAVNIILHSDLFPVGQSKKYNGKEAVYYSKF